MKSTHYSMFFLLLIGQLAFAQDSEFNEFPPDSALVWLNDHYVENPEGFHERALHTLSQTNQLKDEQLMGEAHLLLMRWHAYHVPFTIDSIFDHGEKAIALFERTNDQANLADVSAELAYEYIDENDLERCEKLIFNAIAIYEALEDDKGLGRAYHTMAKIFRSQKDPESAIKYALEAVEFSKKSNDHQTAALAWSVLILAYHDVGELEKAIQAGANSIDILTRFVPEDPFTLARAYGYRGEVWADSGNYQKALEDNLKSYAIVEAEIGAERPAAQTYRQGIGQAYFLQGKYKEALPHLEASIEGYNKLGQSRHPAMQADYEEIAACYYQLGYYQKAFFYQGLAFEIFDTLMQNKVANLESEALIKYESGKKDQALEEQAIMIE
ncbi:MAG: tetratricopeptide repeat protein, partial [Bacteroidetes bacterium]|nr:tetratricopeptide repeat protein [Bacteroidota bacterium]